MKKGILILGMMLTMSACGEKDFDSSPITSQSSSEDDSADSGSYGGTGGSPGGMGAGAGPGAGQGSGTTPGNGTGIPVPPQQQQRQCNSNFLVGTVQTAPAGVSQEIIKAYDDILGRIDIYLPGARYLTSLQQQGYTVTSLRRDLTKTPEFAALLDTVYLYHLKRRPTSYETAVHFNDLMIEATNMRRIEQEIYTRCQQGG